MGQKAETHGLHYRRDGASRSDKQRTSGPHRGGPMHPSLMHLVSTVTTLSLLTVKLQNRYDNLTTFQN